MSRSIRSNNLPPLVKIAEKLGTRAYLFDNAKALNPKWLDGIENLGLTAGASTPEALVDEVIKKIMEYAKAKGTSAELLEV